MTFYRYRELTRWFGLIVGGRGVEVSIGRWTYGVKP